MMSKVQRNLWDPSQNVPATGSGCRSSSSRNSEWYLFLPISTKNRSNWLKSSMDIVLEHVFLILPIFEWSKSAQESENDGKYKIPIVWNLVNFCQVPPLPKIQRKVPIFYTDVIWYGTNNSYKFQGNRISFDRNMEVTKRHIKIMIFNKVWHLNLSH